MRQNPSPLTLTLPQMTDCPLMLSKTAAALVQTMSQHMFDASSLPDDDDRGKTPDMLIRREADKI